MAGNRKTVSFVPGAGKEAGCVAAAGDYLFTGGWKERGPWPGANADILAGEENS